MLRGSAAATVAIFAALAGHVSAGGEMPGPLGIIVPWLLSLMVSVLLAGRRLSVIRLSLSVAISQSLFHVLFVLGAIAPATSLGGHVHGSVPLPLAEGALATVAPDAAMWLGHLIAAAVTVAALHRGERLLLALRDLAQQSIRWLRARFDTTLPALPARTPLRPLTDADVDALHGIGLLRVLRGRAPPAVHSI